MYRQLDELVETLHRHNELKVWSLIVTFFGDAIVPRGGAVSARTVQTVMQRLGVDAGAVRTAFSRLAADGWMVRQKQGRFSYYQLSSDGEHPFETAALRIYAAPNVRDTHSRNLTDDRWLVIFIDPDSKTDIDEFCQAFNAVALHPSTLLLQNPGEQTLAVIRQRIPSEQCLMIDGEMSNPPQWLKQRLGSDETAELYRRLITRFSALSSDPPSEPLDAIATRCLLIHEWRRLTLRMQSVPACLLPDDWPGDICHALVAGLYSAVSPAAENWLDTSAQGPEGSIKVVTRDHEVRFR